MLDFDTIFLLIDIVSWTLIIVGLGYLVWSIIELIKSHKDNSPYYNFVLFMTIMASIVMLGCGIYLFF